jgi:outer membrane protein assembly factor BamB
VGDQVIVATEGGSLYSLDATSGRINWQRHLGAPVSGESLPCGNISPLGITGTPVADPETGLIFAVFETQGPKHMLAGVDMRTGALQLQRDIDPPGMDPQTQQQRGALTLANGRVYVPFGGLFGDCGDYNGYMVASATNGIGDLDVFKTPDRAKGAIWAPPGASVGPDQSLYVSTGNTESQQSFEYGNSVLRLSPQLKLMDYFAPSNWADLNASDGDLGSTAPTILPGGLINQVGKSGISYLLHAGHLGGIGGQVASLASCPAYGGVASTGDTMVIPCTTGISALRVTPQPGLAPAWQGPADVTGTATVVGDSVLALDTHNGTLHALSLATGQDRSQVQVGPVTRFAAVSVSRGRAFVGTKQGVVSIGL